MAGWTHSPSITPDCWDSMSPGTSNRSTSNSRNDASRAAFPMSARGSSAPTASGPVASPITQKSGVGDTDPCPSMRSDRGPGWEGCGQPTEATRATFSRGPTWMAANAPGPRPVAAPGLGPAGFCDARPARKNATRCPSRILPTSRRSVRTSSWTESWAERSRSTRASTRPKTGGSSRSPTDPDGYAQSLGWTGTAPGGLGTDGGR